MLITETKVFNKKNGNVPVDAIYCGRSSIYGNPFKAKDKSMEERLRVIEEFREYAEIRLKREPNWLEPLYSKDIWCWCAPLPCHCDVILELKKRIVQEEWARRNQAGREETAAVLKVIEDLPKEEKNV